MFIAKVAPIPATITAFPTRKKCVCWSERRSFPISAKNEICEIMRTSQPKTQLFNVKIAL